ncbi:MAG: UPF0182 family protein, partial [Gammaproteobacteria bacterium]
MYILILLCFVTVGGWFIRHGLRLGDRRRLVAGIFILISGAGLFGFMSLWGEMLWFEALGLERRFWLLLGGQAAALVGGAVTAAALAATVTWSVRDRRIGIVATTVAAFGGALWGAYSWSELLVFVGRVSTGKEEPLFGADTGFFLFSLPFYDRLYGLALIGVVAGTGAALFASLLRLRETVSSPEGGSGGSDLSLLAGSTVLAMVLAAGQILSACHLVFSDLGVVRGAGWTDVHLSLPVRLVLAVLLAVLGALMLSGRFRQHAARLSARVIPLRVPLWNALLTVWLAAGALWAVGWGVLPTLVQWLIVEPNEISFERSYLKRNIDFTRHGFRLDRIEERRFPAGGSFTPATAAENRDLLSEVRLWDWRALDAVYKQFQEIRLYYEFVDVDMDRYSFNGRYRQVMASARELAQDNLAPQSQTFVNRRFKYTHGYGLTLATVSDFTPEGLPNLLVKDIPPRSEYRELDVSRPQIYYGELTSDPVVVHSEEEEFDYPSG